MQSSDENLQELSSSRASPGAPLREAVIICAIVLVNVKANAANEASHGGAPYARLKARKPTRRRPERQRW
jgi:hypothetical protein